MKHFFYLSMFGILIILNSCAPKITMIDTSCPGYKNIDFERSYISEKGIGIMPVLGGGEKEQFRRPMGEAITKYFRQSFNSGNIKSPSQVIESINNADLTKAYSIALDDYRTTGIVPRKMVSELANVLDVNYLLYTRLLSDSEVETYYTTVYNSTYVTQKKVDEIYVQCQIWDARVGDIVWEGKGGAAKFVEDKTDLVDQTAKGITKVIGIDTGRTSCLDKSALFKAAREAQSNTTLAWTSILLIALFVPFLLLSSM